MFPSNLPPQKASDKMSEQSEVNEDKAGPLASTTEPLQAVSKSEGHQRKLEITFSLWSTLGLVYSLTATPFGIGAFLSFSLVLGGPPFFIYAYIFAMTFQILLCVALAEIAAIYPHPSAHTYWIGKLAPEGWERGLSYWTGALTAAAWYFWTAGTFLLAAEILLAAIEVLYPDYQHQPYHTVLLAWMEAIIGVIWNIPAFKSWSYTLKAMIFITNCGMLFIVIALLVQATPKRTAHEVFVEVVNLSGWSSKGVVFFLGLLPGSAALNGFDSAAHMTEEVPNPAKQIPQVMVWNALFSGISGLPAAIIFCFCITDVDSLMAPVGGVTIIQIFADGMNSKALFVIASVIYFVVVTIAGAAAVTTASRVWWALSEHNGLPFHSFFAKVSKTKHWTVPANAIFTIAFLSCLIGLLELGPSFIVGALYSAASVNFYVGYGATIACFLWVKWTKGLPHHSMNLGRLFGNIVGIMSIIWCAFVSVWLLFPYFLPVTGTGMNYTSAVVAVVIFVFSFDYFLRGRREYFIPSPLII